MPPARLKSIHRVLNATKSINRNAPRCLACRFPLAAFSSSPATSLRKQRGQTSVGKSKKKEQDDEDWDDGSGIRWFEKDIAPNAKARRVPRETVEERQKLEQDMGRLVEQYEQSKKYEQPWELIKHLGSQMFSKDELEQMRNPTDRPPLSEKDVEGILNKTPVKLLEAGVETKPLTAEWFEIPNGVSRDIRRVLEQLDDAMDEVAMGKITSKKRKDVWRCYEHGKTYYPGLPMIFPSYTWSLLWRSQDGDSSDNRNRLQHLKVLADDMLNAGTVLTREQRFARLEGMFLGGQRSQALEEYEHALKNGDGGIVGFLEMGIRMHSLQGNLERAGDLFDVLFKLHPESDPRIILPFIRSCAAKDDNQRAWALYSRLRQRLGRDMTIDDYDYVSLSFLKAESTDLALAVFRDMMVSAPQPEDLPTSMFLSPVDRFGEFISLSDDVEEVNKMSLLSLTFLPRQLQNRFFYGKWIKRLMSLGTNESACQVFELMMERGVTPDSRHLNELIYSWLVKGGSKEEQEKALSMGFEMIQRRLSFVKERKMKKQPELQVTERSVYASGLTNIPEIHRKPYPAATTETFTILAEHYLRGADFEHVRHLRDLLFYAELPMSSYFMNNLLYAELRNNGPRQAWSRYEVMSRNVRPDLETFSCLWSCTKDWIDQEPDISNQGSARTGVPSARELFARMVVWFAKLNGRNLEFAKTEMQTNPDTYNQIVRCFIRSKDLAGAFVAVHAMQKLFNAYPLRSTIRIFQSELYLSETESAAKSGGWFDAFRKKQKSPKDVFSMILKKRQEIHEANGVVLEELTEHEGTVEMYRVVLQFLYTMTELHRVDKDYNRSTEQHIARVTEKMGVERFDVKGVFNQGPGD